MTTRQASGGDWSAECLPALLGGAPVRPEGPPPWPIADEAVREALESAWRDGAWGRYDGGRVVRWQERLGEWLGLPYVVTCGSGTFAVELALRAVGVEAGDEVVLAGYDYPGNFLTVHALGAHPVLVDVDAGDANLAVEALAEALGPATKAVIVSHLHGGLAPMRAVMELCAARAVPVVEDAAQAIGATVQGRPAGTWGDVGTFSFGGSKLVGAGRGGAIVTRSARLHQRARLAQMRGNVVCPLSELQAAVLLPQLECLSARHQRRRAAVPWLSEALTGVPGLRPFAQRTEGDPAYYKWGLWLDPVAFGLSRARLVAAVRAEGIALDEGFRALHAGRSSGRFRAVRALAQATRAGDEVVVLHHPVLLGDEADWGQVVEAVRRVRAHAAALA